MGKIAVQCPGCGRRYAAPESRAGSSLNCLDCATPIPIPAPARQVPFGGGLLEAEQQAAYLPPSQPAAHAAGGEGLDPVVKIAIGVGVVALGGLMLAIAVHSWGGSGDSPEMAQAPVSTEPVANGQPSVSQAVADSSLSRPVPVVAAEPRILTGRDYYEEHGWVEMKDIGGKFTQWFPALVQYKELGGQNMKIITATYRDGRKEGCNMAIVIQDQELPGDISELKQYVENRLATRLPPGATIISQEWKQDQGLEYLDVKVSTGNGAATEFTRFYARKNWMVALSWQVIQPHPIDEHKVNMFMSGFEVTGE